MQVFLESTCLSHPSGTRLGEVDGEWQTKKRSLLNAPYPNRDRSGTACEEVDDLRDSGEEVHMYYRRISGLL